MLNRPQHFERSASRIIEVRSRPIAARQADHRVIGLTDWEWDGLLYHFKRTRGVRPCSHLFRFAFRSRSGPVPLVRVAFTPAKIDRTRSGCGPVTRSHLFRNATGTRTVTHTPSAHQVFFNFWSVFISEGDIVDGFASSTETVSY